MYKKIIFSNSKNWASSGSHSLFHRGFQSIPDSFGEYFVDSLLKFGRALQIHETIHLKSLVYFLSYSFRVIGRDLYNKVTELNYADLDNNKVTIR